MGNNLAFQTSTLFRAGVRMPPNVKGAEEKCVKLCFPFPERTHKRIETKLYSPPSVSDRLTNSRSQNLDHPNQLQLMSQHHLESFAE